MTTSINAKSEKPLNRFMIENLTYKMFDKWTYFYFKTQFYISYNSISYRYGNQYIDNQVNKTIIQFNNQEDKKALCYNWTY